MADARLVTLLNVICVVPFGQGPLPVTVAYSMDCQTSCCREFSHRCLLLDQCILRCRHNEEGLVGPSTTQRYVAHTVEHDSVGQVVGTRIELTT